MKMEMANCILRGHVYMISAMVKGRRIPQKWTSGMISFVNVTVTRGEEGVLKPKKFVESYVIGP